MTPDGPARLADLVLDMEAAPVPDVIGGIDFGDIYRNLEAVNLAGADGDCLVGEYWVPDNTFQRQVHMWSFSLRSRLARLLDPHRDAIERNLHPSVTSYRTGVASVSGRRRDYQGYLLRKADLMASDGDIMTLDILQAHESISTAMVLEGLQAMGIAGPEALRICSLLDSAMALGSPPVVRGLADGALLLNVALASIDSKVVGEWVRWGDDYLVVTPRGSGPEALAEFSQILENSGLALNRYVSEVLTLSGSVDSGANDFAREADERGGWDRLIAAGRAGRSEIIRSRHALRMLIPLHPDMAATVVARLRVRQRDLPRACAALASLEEYESVRSEVEEALIESIGLRDWWACCWISALAARSLISPVAAGVVWEATADASLPVQAWGLLLRLLAPTVGADGVERLVGGRAGSWDLRAIAAARSEAVAPRRLFPALGLSADF